ncbi:Aldo/keto reductase [Marasmius fiardii PR-910]|nr:Aldo/keto reductase [Marasmius fiardii PR-910]
MSFNKSITLNNGVKMPQIGLGTWQSAPGQVQRAVVHALKSGYRHIDAAVIYGSQKEVAEGIKSSGVPRSEIFLVQADLDNTLAELETDYLDLFLIHWPVPFQPGKVLSPTRARDDSTGEKEVTIDTEAPSIAETWKAMGKVKAIGVSNFSVKHLEILKSASDVIPSVNQIEAHPLLQQPDLISYCSKKGIHLTAYSPLGQNITGRPPVIDHPTVIEIANFVGATPAQVLIAWGVTQGYSVIPKSVTPGRIESNFQQITLPPDALQKISDIPNTPGQSRMRYNVPFVYKPRWDINIFDDDGEKDASRSVW